MKRSKGMALTLAGILTVSALFAGTYAWQSISQKALNQVKEIRNPGARLHDDFSGIASYGLKTGEDAKVKNVYVENFTDASDGGESVYARIRLEEYLEKGSGAGSTDSTVNKATPLVNTANINNLSTWEIYKWDDDPVFRDYIDIAEGGSTVYMPTFNRNCDSLEADINGTLAGRNNIAYGDYVNYMDGDQKVGVEIYDADDDTADEAEKANITTEQLIEAVIYTEDDSLAGKNAGDLKISTSSTDITVTTATGSVVCPCKVETDTNDSSKITAILVDLDSSVNTDYDVRIKFTKKQHTAAKTQAATLISMDDWMSAGSPVGNYWVCDEDGWAYWAKPLEPGETSGCLINQITLKPSANITGEYYYGLNVRAQFATAGDWGNGTFTTPASTTNTISTLSETATGFYTDGITENAMRLLEKVAGTARTVEITTDDAVLAGLKGGDEVTFSAKMMMGSVEIKDSSDSIVWTIDGAKSEKTTCTVNQDGTMKLTIGEDEKSYSVIVTASSKKDEKVAGYYTVPIRDFYSIEIAQLNTENVVGHGTKNTLNAVVSKRGAVDQTLGVSWSIKEQDLVASETSIEEKTGVLTIAEDETLTSITVVATCKADEDLTKEYQLTVEGFCETIQRMTAGGEKTIKIDGMEWYVMAKKTLPVDSLGTTGECALLWAADGIKENDAMKSLIFDNEKNIWYIPSDKSINGEEYSSKVRTFLNTDFLDAHSVISEKAVDYTIKTRPYFNSGLSGVSDRPEEWYESTQKVFLLSEADLYGTVNHGSTAITVKPDDFTVDGKRLVSEELQNTSLLRALSAGGFYWLRSPAVADIAVTVNDSYGPIGHVVYNSEGCVRPAVWISLE